MFCRVSIGFFFSAAAGLLAQAPASISGTLVGDDGVNLAGSVIVQRNGPPAGSGQAQAGNDGKFTVSNLQPGTYTMCAAVKGRAYLDPCLWSHTPATVQVGAGQTVTGVRLIAKKGEQIQVHLSDPAFHLPRRLLTSLAQSTALALAA